MRLGVILGGLLFGSSGQLGQLPGVARAAEQAGVDLVTLPDHVVLGGGFDRYPYGEFPASASLPYPEPLTTLAAVAAVTSSIELHTSAVIVPLRPAVLLAKTCATVDVLSGGRLVVGAGAGWHEDEFAASGVPFAGRGERMDDALRACRALWSSAPASFSSSTVSFEGITCEPRPVRGSIPIWVAGTSAGRAARRLADYADGWIPPPSLTIEEISDGVARIRESVSKEFEVSYSLPIVDGDLDRSLAMVPTLREAGVTVVQVTVGRFVAGPEEAPAFFERLVSGWNRVR